MIFFLTRLAKRRIINPPPFARVVALLVAVLAYGSTGYVYFELEKRPELSWLDGLWWAIVTLTTVGYGDHFPNSMGGRFLVAAPLMLFGIGLLGYVISLVTSSLVESRAKELKGMAPITLTQHVLIFNFPSLDKIERLVDELRREDPLRHEIVLVDEDLAELPTELVDRDVRFVRGNPSRDETLERANVDHATHAIILSKRPGEPHSDDLNISITLAIEARAPSVRTTVECVEFGAQELLRKAGCDSIVCLARFDTQFIGNEVFQPGMQAVIDDLMSARGQQVVLTAVPEGMATFGDAVAFCQAKGHLPLGLLRSGQSMLNPGRAEKLAAGDQLITIGSNALA
ncbi:MAG: NAD-binding protein [Deltaproteobacteria bacterium]|nr:NAD-binding protein [Deltaproteobacteria bacterium]